MQILNKDDWRAYRDLYIAIPFDFPKEFIKEYLFSSRIWDPDTKKPSEKDIDNYLKFDRAMAILQTDHDFAEYCKNVEDYIDVIYIKKVEPNEPSTKKYDPYIDPVKDTSHVSINYKYINTNMDLSADTFHKAIELNHYVENECWINTIYDFTKIHYYEKTKDT